LLLLMMLQVRRGIRAAAAADTITASPMVMAMCWKYEFVDISSASCVVVLIIQKNTAGTENSWRWR
jgi:hypothetical protein